MRITESNMALASQWAHLRPDERSASPRGADADPPPDPAAVAAANQLDTDRDGWLDEDDIPYDQLMRLARKAQEYAELGGVHLGTAAAVIAPAVATAADSTAAVIAPAVIRPAVTPPAVIRPAVTPPAVATPASTSARHPAEAEPKPVEHRGAPQIDLLA
jgi:hypothetical protein